MNIFPGNSGKSQVGQKHRLRTWFVFAAQVCDGHDEPFCVELVVLSERIEMI